MSKNRQGVILDYRISIPVRSVVLLSRDCLRLGLMFIWPLKKNEWL